MIFIVRGVGGDWGFIYVFKNWVCVKKFSDNCLLCMI